jgi:hypothetical protein
MRLLAILFSVLVMAAPATQAAAADPPPREPAGWSYAGARLVWRAPEPLPVGDAAVEFWEGTRRLGVPKPSADHRTFTLDGARVTDPARLAVRAGGRRVDVLEHRPPLRSQPPPVPAPRPAGAVDPGRSGPYRTKTGEYTLPSIALPGYPAPIEMRAVVVAPVGVPGARPLALFLHGRHNTCFGTDAATLEWPCHDGMQPIPSYRGYLQAQQLLASQGYVTVSISANGVNGQDVDTLDQGAQARSSLVRRHLAQWADWAGAGGRSAPDIVRATRADLSKVLLVGHSRGGEGVNRAALDSLTPPPRGSGYDGRVRWTVRGTLLIGPTIFGHNPAPDVPSVTILPGCDGDVWDLQGQMYLDATRGLSRGAALHSALYVVGANHNYFNTEWTPGQSEAPSTDDFFRPDDPLCSSGVPNRLTPAQQQNVGATYIAAAARLFVAGDQRVLPLVDGSGVRAPSADPARVLSHAVGGARTPLVVPDAATAVSGAGRLCAEVTTDAANACDDPVLSLTQPHFVPLGDVREDPDRFAVTLSGTATIRPARPVSLAGSESIALRLIVPPNSTGNRFDVAVTDTRGRRTQLGTVTLDGLPATEQMSALWAQEVRVPSRGVGEVASLELTSTGQAWLIDASGWRSGLPDPRPVALPRVDVSDLTVSEGDEGTRTYEVEVTASGGGTGQARLFVGTEDGTFTTDVFTVHSGLADEVTVAVTGNTRWSTGSVRWVYAKALHGAVGGDYVGGLRVRDDDPKPTVTIASDGPVAEGGVLTWTATLSAVADSPFLWFGPALPPAEGAELSSTDIDPDWFRASTGEDPEPSRPLSTTPLVMGIFIDPGSLTGGMILPTAPDTEAEPTEYVRLHLEYYPPDGSALDVLGTVTDQ